MKRLFTLLLLIGFVSFSTSSFAQTPENLEQLKADKAAKEAAAAELQGQLDALNGEIATLGTQIDKALRWKFGSGGLIGADLNGFSNWAPKEDLNSSAQSITFSYNGFANLLEDKYFWRNNGGINLGWLRYDTDATSSDPDNPEDFQQVADVFNVQSLFGYNLTKTLALSALGEYRTTILNNFNNPGYLDIGAGLTWTPIPNLVVVVHPLNYNFIFSNDDTAYTSSLGTKFVVDYNKEIFPGVSWRTNLSGFYSYQGTDLSNYTWINGINFTAFKGIGVGAEYGLRWNKQETDARGLTSANQSYYAIGLSYAL